MYTKTRHRRYVKVLFLAIVALLAGVMLTQAVGSINFVSRALGFGDGENATKVAKASNVNDTQRLQLINKDHAVATNKTPKTLTDAYPTVPVSTVSIQLDKTALKALDKMFAAAATAGFKKLYLTSGYRTRLRQQEIYENAEDKSFVQPPGYSEHETGLAADILTSGATMDDFGNSRAGKWLAENAHKYGFILRYPAGKESVTGIAYEPWHFRYVGAPHAAYCQQNDLVYEEYLAQLQETGGYRIEQGKKTYQVQYLKPENGTLDVPESGDLDVSSDNVGGYIVTSWS